MVITKTDPYTKDEIEKLRKEFDVYIKTVIDIKKKVCSAGSDKQFECVELLLEMGSQQEDIWGGGVDLDTKVVNFNSFINMRVPQNNESNEIENEAIRKEYESLIRFFFKEIL